MEVRRRVSSRLGVWGASHPSRGHIFEEQSHPPPQGVRPAHLSCEDLDTMSLIVSDAFLISRLFSSVSFLANLSLTAYLQRDTKGLHCCPSHLDVAIGLALSQPPVTCHSH